MHSALERFKNKPTLKSSSATHSRNINLDTDTTHVLLQVCCAKDDFLRREGDGQVQSDAEEVQGNLLSKLKCVKIVGRNLNLI